MELAAIDLVSKYMDDEGRWRRAGARPTVAVDISAPTPHPHAGAEPNIAAARNKQYIEDLRRWNALPLRKRLRTTKPQRPTGI